MKRDEIMAARTKMLEQLPITGEILRGSLMERLVRHKSGCAVCAGGGGHKVWVVGVSYPGKRTRQFTVRPDQVEEVRRWIDNYQQVKEALEAICELNSELLSAETRRRSQAA